MAVNFNWVISQMECKNEENLSDVVITIHWRRNASEKIEEKEYFAEVYGSISLKAPKKDQFIPYNELTKEQVEGWLNESLKNALVKKYHHNFYEIKIKNIKKANAVGIRPNVRRARITFVDGICAGAKWIANGR